MRLLLRNTRRLALTELGRDFVERARRILVDVDDAEHAMRGHSGELAGRLRVSAPMSFGTLHLSPLVSGFMQLHRKAEIVLDLDDRAVDVIGEGYDVAIRIGILADSALISRKLVELRLAVAASPAYLGRAGVPLSPADLKRHDCLLYGRSDYITWRFGSGKTGQDVPIAGRYRANNGEVIADAAIAGLGLVQLPTFIIGRALAEGRLVEVLRDFAPNPGAAYAVQPPHRERAPLVRAFIDYLAACMNSD